MDSADRVNEKCAVVGVFNVKNSALACYYCLFAMQHRGQESSGISTTNGHKITTLKGEGLVTAVFSEGLDKLKGSASIGHNRYSTAGEDSKCDTQPIFAKYALGEIALAHNGNLVNAKEVRDELIAQGAIFQSHLDTENLIHLIARSKQARLRDRIIEGLQQIKGAYSFVILSRGKLFAVRDPWGFRPLSLGEIINDDGSKGYVVASESCAFDLVGARFVRDIKPGEMLIFSLDSAEGNSSLGMQFRTCEKFWESADSSPALSQNFSQIQKPHRKYFDFDSQGESATKQTQNADSSLDSADSQNLGENISSLRDSAKQNRGKPHYENIAESQSGLPREQSSLVMTENMKIAESALNSVDSQNLQSGLPREQSSLAMTENMKIAESALNSVDSQNLQSGLPCEQSSLAMTENMKIAESALNSVDSQNLQSGLPREQSSLAMTENMKIAESALNSVDSQNLQSGLPREQSSLAMTENKAFAESSLDSAPSKQEANSSIVDEFSHLCEASDDDRIDSSSRKRALRKCEKSPQDAEFAINAQFESIQVFPPTPKHCIFEFVYFARPDSVVFNKSVYEIRKNMGIQLAREYKIKADFVIPVPDSGVISALGYAQESGIPFEFGIVRNHYIGRTFIEPTQKSRELKVKLKLNPIARLLQGREIVVIDDSVVRGTTSKQIISILRKAGAKKVHLVVASPQTIAPCYYGVDTPDSADLICANKSLEEVCEFIGADSLHFLSLEGLYKSIGIENGEHYCKACFDGEYII